MSAHLRNGLVGLHSVRRWRPSLRLSVGLLAVAVVVGMAVVLAEVVAGHLRSIAADAAVHNVEAIVRGYVDPQVDEGSLALDALPEPGISDELERLIVAGDIRVISIWSRDARIVYSTAAELRGRRFSIDDLVARAFLGTSISAYAVNQDHSEGTPGPTDTQPVLQIFVPIRGLVDGDPIGVYEVEQDARPIEDRVETTRRDVFLLALAAATVLLIILAVAFAGTSALLGRQNRLLRARAETERLLGVDLRRSEERFRSLVRSSSDVILIIDADGTIGYESPAVARVLGYDPEERVGTSAYDAIHDADVAWIRSLIADISTRTGAEAAADFRARHADGSWRWLQATAKNLLNDPAVSAIVVNYRDITDRRALEEQLRYQAFHDALSGLPNRALFMDRLDHALTRARRDQSAVAVLFLDLDDFKSVNDGLGHGAGDELLVSVAERLNRTLRDADTAARMGGDEFAILLEDAHDKHASVEIAERILEVLRAPFTVQGQHVRIRGSVGIALYTDPEQTADELLRHADVAMYAAKSQGKDRLMVFQPDVHLVTIDRHQLKADLHLALDNGEFTLLYQPVVDLESTTITGVEALIRWQHPRRGLIGPTEFIPLAEESGMIVPVGRWVLAEACRQGQAWQEGAARPLTMSVNLSARQIDDIGLIDDVAAALRDSGLDPALLTLEITESVLLSDMEVVMARLRALKSLGVRLAIDDFGTGYSSLSYLRNLPVDVLKIDRSFVAAVDSGTAERALVRSIVSLAQILGLETVAEGIEEPSQLAALRSAGAQFGQGFLFAEPLDAHRVPAALARVTSCARPRRRAASPAPRRGRRPVRAGITSTS
ncbi:MAG: EAL domain-containing protein [Chloroflexota bacterium]